MNTQNTCHLHTIKNQKLGPLKIWESHHFSLVWVIGLIIISTCFSKGKVFS